MPPPPLRRPAGEATATPLGSAETQSQTARSTVLNQGWDLLVALLFDRRYLLHLTAFLLLGELFLGLLIIRYVPCTCSPIINSYNIRPEQLRQLLPFGGGTDVADTKIDWEAYMQHVECFLGGERDYSKLEGETGGAVYPALFLYVYTAFYKLLPSDPELRVRAAQYIFLGIYLATFTLVARIYYAAGTALTSRKGEKGWSTYPQALLIPLCLSKRLHSIYMLRLFNDPIAMVLLYAGVACMMQRTKVGWTVGVGLYSLALGVKMNILLFLPGLLVLLVQYRGIARTIEAVSTMAVVQVLLPAAFFLGSVPDAQAYFSTAFNFSRQFMYKWTVNWRFVPEDTFLSSGFAKALLAGQLFFLVTFALFKWSPVNGGTLQILRNALLRPTQPAALHTFQLPNSHIPVVLFTSNLIGIAFARSLHYQFHSWYFHQIPLLLYAGGAWGSLPLGLVLWLGIEYAWATFPSTNLSSGVLSVAHAVIILGLLFSGSSRTRWASVADPIHTKGSYPGQTKETEDSRKVR